MKSNFCLVLGIGALRRSGFLAPTLRSRLFPSMILQNKNYLILGIGTDIGKTFLVENFCRILRQKKISVTAIKPVISGFKDGDLSSDSVRILAALGLKISKKNLDSISPWRFEAAVSPHFAAEIAEEKISFAAVKKFCLERISQAKKQNQILLIEAAGGVMTPITVQKNFLDLAVELKIPVLLVSANYLGSISHTLCAVEALKSRKIVIERIIVNEVFPESEKTASVQINQVIETIKNFSKIETISLKDFLKFS
jgi:dethiobiotin synthetase